jgi:hypothetical protein
VANLNSKAKTPEETTKGVDLSMLIYFITNNFHFIPPNLLSDITNLLFTN